MKRAGMRRAVSRLSAAEKTRASPLSHHAGGSLCAKLGEKCRFTLTAPDDPITMERFVFSGRRGKKISTMLRKGRSLPVRNGHQSLRHRLSSSEMHTRCRLRCKKMRRRRVQHLQFPRIFIDQLSLSVGVPASDACHNHCHSSKAQLRRRFLELIRRYVDIALQDLSSIIESSSRGSSIVVRRLPQLPSSQLVFVYSIVLWTRHRNWTRIINLRKDSHRRSEHLPQHYYTQRSLKNQRHLTTPNLRLRRTRSTRKFPPTFSPNHDQ